MGYACPVCETPQQDARHLANHLAFTAMVHGDEHEAWLDDHVPEWAQLGEAELGPEVAELAPEADYEQVFEDTAQAHGHDHDHAHDHQHGGADAGVGGVDPAAAAAAGQGSLDEETRRILEEAQELTAEMLDDGESEANGSEGDDPERDGADAEE